MTGVDDLPPPLRGIARWGLPLAIGVIGLGWIAASGFMPRTVPSRELQAVAGAVEGALAFGVAVTILLDPMQIVLRQHRTTDLLELHAGVLRRARLLLAAAAVLSPLAVAAALATTIAVLTGGGPVTLVDAVWYLGVLAAVAGSAWFELNLTTDLFKPGEAGRLDWIVRVFHRRLVPR